MDNDNEPHGVEICRISGRPLPSDRVAIGCGVASVGYVSWLSAGLIKSGAIAAGVFGFTGVGFVVGGALIGGAVAWSYRNG